MFDDFTTDTIDVGEAELFVRHGGSGTPVLRLINADPDAWHGAGPEQMGAEAYEDFRRAVHDPATLHAMCEDYRAGLGVDRAAAPMTPTRRRAAEWPVPRSSCGRPGTTWRACTATRWRCGAPVPRHRSASPAAYGRSSGTAISPRSDQSCCGTFAFTIRGVSARYGGSVCCAFLKCSDRT